MTEVVRAPKTTGHLRQLEQMVRGELPAPPIARLVGFTILDGDSDGDVSRRRRIVHDADLTAKYSSRSGTRAFVRPRAS